MLRRGFVDVAASAPAPDDENRRLREALELLWKAIDHRDHCGECYGNGQWSGMCPQCGYLFDDAVEKALEARAALAPEPEGEVPDGA